MFHQQRDPKNLMISLDGGGACWQDFYNCSITADGSPPTGGIFADSGAGSDNPLADWSKVFVSYCDVSVFSGDNTVQDANFPRGVRHHRGLRNLTAALDLARDLHPAAKKVLLGGISAGGFAVLDIISPCVTFNNEDNAHHSYAWGKDHEEPLHDITYIAPRAEILLDPEMKAGEVREVTMHDGSVVVLKNVEKRYNPIDRYEALRTLEDAQQHNWR